jgi:hypothetical protein
MVTDFVRGLGNECAGPDVDMIGCAYWSDVCTIYTLLQWAATQVGDWEVSGSTSSIVPLLEGDGGGGCVRAKFEQAHKAGTTDPGADWCIHCRSYTITTTSACMLWRMERKGLEMIVRRVPEVGEAMRKALEEGLFPDARGREDQRDGGQGGAWFPFGRGVAGGGDERSVEGLLSGTRGREEIDGGT